MKGLISLLLTLSLLLAHPFMINAKNFQQDVIDQKQTEETGEEKVYGKIRIAQSFVPSQDEITKIKIKVGRIRTFKMDSIKDFIKSVLKFFLKALLGRQPIFHVSVRKSLEGEEIFNAVFDSHNIGREQWIEINVGNISHQWKEKFYIICYSENGEENDCFSWFYADGNVYQNGSSFIFNDTWKETERDYCFISYGREHIANGNSNYIALLIGIENYQKLPPSTYSSKDAEDMDEILRYSGWKNIYLLINEDATLNKFREMLGEIDMQEDEDDIFLLLFSGWGNSDCISLYDENLTSHDLSKEIDRLGGDKIIIIDCWYSGGLIDELAKRGRMIMTSCEPYEKSWRYDLLRNSVFIYYIVDGLNGNADNERYGGNGDGNITAEEIFRYARYYTEIFEKPQHPQMYDGIEGDTILAPLT